MNLSELTSVAAVEEALDEFDALGRDAFLEKYGYGKARRSFVRRDGSYYDSKAIVGAAAGHQSPKDGPLNADQFPGGEHGAKARLESLGFEVVPRPALAAADTLPLREALAAALAAQQARSPGQWSDDLQKAVAVTLPNAIRATVAASYRVKGSAGAGNQAEIPWVSVMPPELKGASEGQYVVYLFSASGDRVYLCLSLAVTGKQKTSLKALAAELRNRAGEQPDLLPAIDLGAAKSLGQKYELGTAYAIEYETGSLPAEPDLEAHLQRFLDLLEIADNAGDTPAPPAADSGDDPAGPGVLKAVASGRHALARRNDRRRDRHLGGPSPQVVFAGPPGTGKTWVAKHLITYLTQGRADRNRIVQFHPSYGYEDFTEGLRPAAVDGSMTFERVDGIVLEVVNQIEGQEEPFYLLIDEMNRANLARVFGELMYLFEYRDERMSLRYTSDFRLPRTLRFVGTMNTADRSIRSIDIALRRRFEVFECPPSLGILQAFYDSDGRVNEVESLLLVSRH